MKTKWKLIASIFQLLIGLSAVVAFIVLCCGGEVMTRWIITMILGIAFAVMGVIEILDDKKKK